MQKAPSDSDHDLAPLRIDDSTWETLEKQLGVSLNKDARNEIIAAADEFAVAQHFSSIDNARRKLRGLDHSPTSISKLRANLNRVLENWREIQSDSTAKRLFEDISDELALGDVAYSMEFLHHFVHRLDAYLSLPKYDPFSCYVKRISGVYEKVTGKPVTIAIPSGVKQRISKFVMVMMTLNTALPDYAQHEHSTPAAWALAMYRARK